MSNIKFNTIGYSFVCTRDCNGDGGTNAEESIVVFVGRSWFSGNVQTFGSCRLTSKNPRYTEIYDQTRLLSLGIFLPRFLNGDREKFRNCSLNTNTIFAGMIDKYHFPRVQGKCFVLDFQTFTRHCLYTHPLIYRPFPFRKSPNSNNRSELSMPFHVPGFTESVG